MSYWPSMSAGPNGRTFLLLAVFAIAVRLALVATTYGTNDVGFMATSVSLVNQVGIPHSYSYTRMMNHPPFSFACMRFYGRVAAATGTAYGDIFRLFQVLADAIAAAALYAIGVKLKDEMLGRKLALFLLLSPAAAFISGFHGNTDASLMMFVLLSVALLAWGRPALAGLALALAAGIKIVPFAALPAGVAAMPRPFRLPFLAAFALTAAVLFVPAIAIGGPNVVRVVFGYAGGLHYEWGFPGVAFALSRNVAALRTAGREVMEFYVAFGRYFVLAGVAAATMFIIWRRRTDARAFPHAVEIVIMTMLVLAPGWGVQYIVWILALLPFAFGWRTAIALNAAASLFLFITYTVWSGGWPWWYADIARPGPHRYVAALAGYAMWAVVCAALAIAFVRFKRTPQPETAG